MNPTQSTELVQTPPRILVLGVGNILLQDEGVGVHVVRRLEEQFRFPEHVELLDGATAGLELLPYFDGVGRLLVVDVVDAGKPPGTIVRLDGEELPAFFSVKISPHQLGLSDLLAVAELTGKRPAETVAIGIQPASLETGLELSPVVADHLADIVAAVIEQLAAWDVQPTPAGERGA
ncbi:MAG: HyaD/HybD family hydrogenase maturation endopeptidase [Chloroflexi bacterium]|nr:HyaD/HybD family hydrogenase maturation endopeptidase [Chloroflexota bacterium]